MARAISVLLAVLVLLGVGWYFGHRPLATVKDRAAEDRRAFGDQAAALEARTVEAEARAHLWAARGELLAAALEARDRNFGKAGEHAARARDLITRAAAVPGFTLDLGPVRDMAEAASALIAALDPTAADSLRRAGDEIARLLDQGGRA